MNHRGKPKCKEHKKKKFKSIHRKTDVYESRMNDDDDLHEVMANNEKILSSLTENEFFYRKTIDKVLCEPQNGFTCIISMYDGIVIYATQKLAQTLGYPNDMLVGNSFIDIVHPKDKTMLSGKIANLFTDKTEICVYANLRNYNGLSNGFHINKNTISYQPFQMTLTLCHTNEDEDEDGFDDVFTVLIALPVCKTYKVPEEMLNGSRLMIRHNTDCVIDYVDAEVINYFGFLPQDMLGQSIFDFYHPEDMAFVQEVYNSIVRTSRSGTAGSVYFSKPYRFLTKNHDYVLIRTEWTSVVNSWTKKLESITGIHDILKGPKDIDIFTPKERTNQKFNEQILENGRTIRSEIVLLLNKDIKVRQQPTQKIINRCKKFADKIDGILNEINKNKTKNIKSIDYLRTNLSDLTENCDNESNEHISSYRSIGNIRNNICKAHQDNLNNLENEKNWMHLYKRREKLMKNNAGPKHKTNIIDLWPPLTLLTTVLNNLQENTNQKKYTQGHAIKKNKRFCSEPKKSKENNDFLTVPPNKYHHIQDRLEKILQSDRNFLEIYAQPTLLNEQINEHFKKSGKNFDHFFRSMINDNQSTNNIRLKPTCSSM